jgi:hypothetical protein
MPRRAFRGVVAVGSFHRGADAGLQRFARQSPVLHPGRRGEHDQPGLARSLEPNKPVRMLVPRFLDRSLESQRLVALVTAPSVMGPHARRAGETEQQRDSHGAGRDSCSTHRFPRYIRWYVRSGHAPFHPTTRPPATLGNPRPVHAKPSICRDVLQPTHLAAGPTVAASTRSRIVSALLAATRHRC